ncbi:MAG TPA: DNA repair protein RecO [Steroidobacteraceae bacterium]|nr:DNA repair protein RecO [Steroidobacteraceae bacterium]
MSPTRRHTQLTPGYILHHMPYRDTSRILEVLTREHGRLSLFARGVRGPRSRLAPLLQPFRLLLFSWSGRGEAPQLTGAEPAGTATAAVALPAAYLMACFYLNELVLKLTTRHDPHPALFDAYTEALEGFRGGAALEPGLRIFEKRLLTELGYGLDLATESQTGGRIASEAYYRFRPGEGLVAASPDAPGALAGRSLESLSRERLAGAAELDDARRLLRSALDHCLEGRELATRAVAREVFKHR